MFWKVIAWLLARPSVLALLQWSARRPHQVDLGSYMGRWWLFNPYDRPWHTRWLPSVRLHHIRRPDKGRDWHNHPWAFRTFILMGWYLETRPSPIGDCLPLTRRHIRGETALVPYGMFHRIARVSPGGCWTLVVTYRKRGSWGFMDRKGVYTPREFYRGDA